MFVQPKMKLLILIAFCVIEISLQNRLHDRRIEMQTNLRTLAAVRRENAKKFLQNIFNNPSPNNVSVEAQV